jgi:hypothetical protein
MSNFLAALAALASVQEKTEAGRALASSVLMHELPTAPDSHQEQPLEPRHVDSSLTASHSLVERK